MKDHSEIVGKTFTSKSYGDFTVIEYNSCTDVLIEFATTKYRYAAATKNIITGNVKDPLYPSVHGAGCFGIGKYKAFTTSTKKSTKQYKTWIGMLERCYSEKCHKKFPSYIDCTVCKEWLNYQNFAAWFDGHYINGFELDKDIISDGNKVYCPEFCKFVSKKDNIIKASAKTYRMISPSGEIVDVYNVRQFSKDNNLNRDCLRFVMTGKQKAHKGWTKA